MGATMNGSPNICSSSWHSWYISVVGASMLRAARAWRGAAGGRRHGASVMEPASRSQRHGSPPIPSSVPQLHTASRRTGYVAT